MINRRIVGERGIGNFGDNSTVLQHPHPVLADYAADLDRVEPPLAEHAIDFFLAAFLCDQQHALLRFAQKNFVSAHAGLALRYAVHLNFDPNVTARAHFAS